MIRHLISAMEFRFPWLPLVEYWASLFITHPPSSSMTPRSGVNCFYSSSLYNHHAPMPHDLSQEFNLSIAKESGDTL